MSDIQKIVNKINEFSKVKSSSKEGGELVSSIKLTVKKESSDLENSLSIPVRTEGDLESILTKLNFDDTFVKNMVDKFNNLLSEFDVKRLERFIIVTNDK
ncbi:hypothetical protein [Psychroflexus tropicus]|uniref:hypothetical protein n=1 Tax=Psychroflexus tropicus TaxID=197345 RepID=UPI00036C4711|nr:hypothetical protein [Psychroflexus tropicus]